MFLRNGQFIFVRWQNKGGRHIGLLFWMSYCLYLRLASFVCNSEKTFETHPWFSAGVYHIMTAHRFVAHRRVFALPVFIIAYILQKQQSQEGVICLVLDVQQPSLELCPYVSVVVSPSAWAVWRIKRYYKKPSIIIIISPWTEKALKTFIRTFIPGL